MSEVKIERSSPDIRQALATAQAEADALRAEVARLRRVLTDPNMVHVNLLRGGIALPTVLQMIHVYGPAVVRNGLETYTRAAIGSEQP